MASQKERGAVEGRTGRAARVTKKKSADGDDEPELIEADVNDFFDEVDAADRRRDPLRGPR
jgi:hypothetical protein